MTTQEVANKLVSLCREGKVPDAINELFADDAVNIEMNDSMGPKETKGKEGILAKAAYFQGTVEEFFGQEISEPIVAGDTFAIAWTIEIKMKGQDRMKMQEICVYKVKDGKVISEQFFY